MILYVQVKWDTESNLSPFNLPTVSSYLGGELFHRHSELKGLLCCFISSLRAPKTGHPFLRDASSIKGFQGSKEYFSILCPRAASSTGTAPRAPQTLPATCENWMHPIICTHTSQDEDGNYSPSINFPSLLLKIIICLFRSKTVMRSQRLKKKKKRSTAMERGGTLGFGKLLHVPFGFTITTVYLKIFITHHTI